MACCGDLTPDQVTHLSSFATNAGAASVTTHAPKPGMNLHQNPLLIYRSLNACIQDQESKNVGTLQANDICMTLARSVTGNSSNGAYDGCEINVSAFTENDDYLVVPITATSEGVHNGAFKSKNELTKGFPFFENKPITILHPPGRGVVGTNEVHGLIKNTRLEPNRGAWKGEAWFFKNEAYLRSIGHDDASLRAHNAVLDSIRKGARFDGSIGYWHHTINEEGSYGGVRYNRMEVNILPDHFAIVDRGASSWENGTGFGQAAKTNRGKNSYEGREDAIAGGIAADVREKLRKGAKYAKVMVRPGVYDMVAEHEVKESDIVAEVRRHPQFRQVDDKEDRIVELVFEQLQSSGVTITPNRRRSPFTRNVTSQSSPYLCSNCEHMKVFHYTGGCRYDGDGRCTCKGFVNSAGNAAPPPPAKAKPKDGEQPPAEGKGPTEQPKVEPEAAKQPGSDPQAEQPDQAGLEQAKEAASLAIAEAVEPLLQAGTPVTDEALLAVLPQAAQQAGFPYDPEFQDEVLALVKKHLATKGVEVTDTEAPAPGQQDPERGGKPLPKKPGENRRSKNAYSGEDLVRAAVQVQEMFRTKGKLDQATADRIGALIAEMEKSPTVLGNPSLQARVAALKASSKSLLVENAAKAEVRSALNEVKAQKDEYTEETKKAAANLDLRAARNAQLDDWKCPKCGAPWEYLLDDKQGGITCGKCGERGAPSRFGGNAGYANDTIDQLRKRVRMAKQVSTNNLPATIKRITDRASQVVGDWSQVFGFSPNDHRRAIAFLVNRAHNMGLSIPSDLWMGIADVLGFNSAAHAEVSFNVWRVKNTPK